MSILLIKNLRAAGIAPSRRKTVVPRFLLKLDGLQAVLSHLQTSSESDVVEGLFIDRYRSMLQKAEESTFACPAGQLSGRAGRRCTLEDGERILDWCIKERPWELRPRVVQLQNVMKQGLGRERDVPWLALKALHETDVQGCDISSPFYVQILQVALLGLKAVYKLELSGDAVPAVPQRPTYTPTSFLQATQQAVPGMAQDLLNIQQRLHRELICCSPGTRNQLLSDRDGYMSCVDLQNVAGQHHALGKAVGIMKQPAVHWPPVVEAQLAGFTETTPARKFK